MLVALSVIRRVLCENLIPEAEKNTSTIGITIQRYFALKL